MKILIIHLKLSQPSLRLQQQSHGVHERLRHKLSCLSGQTQTHWQKQSRDCSPTFWINSLVGSLSPDEWWQPISQHPQNSPDEPSWSWCCRLPPGSAPCRVETFLLATREHLHAQKVSSVDRLAAAVGTVTTWGTITAGVRPGTHTQKQTHTPTCPHPQTHSLSLPLSLSLNAVPTPPLILVRVWWGWVCTVCWLQRGGGEEGKGGGGGGGGGRRRYVLGSSDWEVFLQCSWVSHLLLEENRSFSTTSASTQWATPQVDLKMPAHMHLHKHLSSGALRSKVWNPAVYTHHTHTCTQTHTRTHWWKEHLIYMQCCFWFLKHNFKKHNL